MSMALATPDRLVWMVPEPAWSIISARPYAPKNGVGSRLLPPGGHGSIHLRTTGSTTPSCGHESPNRGFLFGRFGLYSSSRGPTPTCGSTRSWRACSARRCITC